MTRYALVIGIGDYRYEHWNLKTPEGDAEAVAQLLKQYGQCQQVKVLNGYVYTKELEEALVTLINKQGKNNEVIIYFTPSPQWGGGHMLPPSRVFCA